MKYTKSLKFFLVFLLSQALISLASPVTINKDSNFSNESLEKRSFPSFDMREFNIFFLKPEDWNSTVYAYVHFKDDIKTFQSELTEWPGMKMTKGLYDDDSLKDKNFNYYTVMMTYGDFKDTYIIFSDGEKQAPGVLQRGFPVQVNGVYDTTGIVGTRSYYDYDYKTPELSYGNYANIFFRPNNHVNSYGRLEINVYAHYKIGEGEWNSLPGELMNGEPYGGIYVLVLDLGDADEFTICFTDNKGNWDNNHGKNYKFKKHQSYIIDHLFVEDAPLFEKNIFFDYEKNY